MRALVVYCHPDPDSLVAAARDRAIAGLERAGHEVRLCDLYAEGFDPVDPVDPVDGRGPGTRPDLERYGTDLRWAEAIVLVYPTWWSGQPAMLQGWIDRVWVAGVGWSPTADRPGLPNVRRLVAVTTHGSSKLVNALEGEAGKRAMTRSMRALCHRRTRTTWCAVYGLDTADAADRQRFLRRVERTLSRL